MSGDITSQNQSFELVFVQCVQSTVIRAKGEFRATIFRICSLCCESEPRIVFIIGNFLKFLCLVPTLTS